MDIFFHSMMEMYICGKMVRRRCVCVWGGGGGKQGNKTSFSTFLSTAMEIYHFLLICYGHSGLLELSGSQVETLNAFWFFGQIS